MLAVVVWVSVLYHFVMIKYITLVKYMLEKLVVCCTYVYSAWVGALAHEGAHSGRRNTMFSQETLLGITFVLSVALRRNVA